MLIFDDSRNALEISHNGRIAHVEYGEGNTLTVGARIYTLDAVHIHAHSEHRIDQQFFAAELHLIHRQQDGSIGVVGQIFRLGKPDLNQYQGGMCISGSLTMTERTPRHLISPLGPSWVGSDSAV